MITKATAQSAPRLATPARSRSDGLSRLLTPHRRGLIIQQVLIQVFLLIVTVTVMFPVLWIVSMAIDPRGVTRPTDLNLIPANATLDAFYRLLTEPFSNVLPLYFSDLLVNSLFIALGTSIFTVVLGSSAAYAFSRFRFIGRQGGMLAFIILLLLPSTGTVIPLYIMFNAVQLDRTLVEFFPAVFTGGLIAGLVVLLYQFVASLGRYDRDRRINLPPRAVVGVTAVIALALVTATLLILFQRSGVYDSAIEQPLKTIRADFDAAREDYQQRVGSVAQREQTAANREQRAAAVESARAALAAVSDALATGDPAALAADLDAPIADLEAVGYDAENDLTLALSSAQAALAADGANADLSENLAFLTAEAADLAEGAVSARASAEEARANLAGAETLLTDARARVDGEAADILAVRDAAILQILPYALLAWAAALGGAVVVWGIVKALSRTVEPRTALNVLLFALVTSLLIGITWLILEARLANSRGDFPALRQTLLGLSLAFASGALPFSIWNLKGYFDTIPKELEEAALIDGAGLFETFIRVMVPLAAPAFAIVILFSFMSGWTEFILSWVFLTGETQSYTLAMALATMANGGNAAPPDMQKFAAMAILISLPIITLFFAFQRWIVGGLAIGGVKG
jgi:ABC-type maltose transport system permease subunit